MNHRDLQIRRLQSYVTELEEMWERSMTMSTETLERLCDAIDAALEDADYTPDFSDAE